MIVLSAVARLVDAAADGDLYVGEDLSQRDRVGVGQHHREGRRARLGPVAVDQPVEERVHLVIGPIRRFERRVAPAEIAGAVDQGPGSSGSSRRRWPPRCPKARRDRAPRRARRGGL